MNAQINHLDCPRCACPMDVTQAKRGLFVDHCGRCGGTWYDAGEFEQSFHVEGALNVQGEGTRKVRSVPCPRCEHGLVEMNWPPGSGVRIDACPKCAGMWLDAGEAPRIQRALRNSGRITDVSEPSGPAPQRARVTDVVDTTIHELVDTVKSSGFEPGRAALAGVLMLVAQGALLGVFQAVRLLRMMGDSSVSADTALHLSALLVSAPLAAAIFARLVDRLYARELGVGVALAALLILPLAPTQVSTLAVLGVTALAVPLALLVAKVSQPL